MRTGTARKVAQAVVIERLLSFADKFVDIAMIVALIIWGPMACFLVGFVAALIFCIIVLEIELRYRATGVEHLRDWAYAAEERIYRPSSIFLRMAQWVARQFRRLFKALLRVMFRSYWLTLLIGSVFYLESDYVTLLLRRPNESRLSTYVRVMLPSVTWSIGVWTAIYWFSLEFALWAWYELVGCDPSECLVQEGWQPIITALRYLEGFVPAIG